MDSYTVKVAPVARGGFSTSAAYEVLDIVNYNGRSYIFQAAKAAGAWDETKVMPFGSGASEITDGGGSAQF